MRTAIALRHLHFEDIGTFASVLNERGYQLQYLDPTIDNLDNTTVTASVREIASVADAQTRTYRVRLALPELPAAARLGMTASVRFDAASDKQALQLPLTALFQQGEQPAVWVLPNEADRLELRPITLAAMGTNTITLTSGITPGERVVIAGVHRLDSAMQVQAWDGRLP